MKWFFWVVVVFCIGCSSDASAPVDEVDASADLVEVDAAPDVGETCVALYGAPTEATGLDATQCAPACACSEVFEAPTFDQARLDDFAGRVLLEPAAALTADPYETPEAYQYVPENVCAVVTEANGYRLQTFENSAAAEAAGASVTHFGGCGLCSSLENLVAYIRNPDLTDPVRDCGVQGITQGQEANVQCLMDLGFDRPCADIWYYNTVNTREACGATCIRLLNEPYHLPDGSLNECLQCDEDESGPVFKAVAGRTRRNSGLASAICRPCDTVRPVAHDY